MSPHGLDPLPILGEASVPQTPSDLSDRDKQRIEWYKNEYKLVYDRYENIYKAIWTVFQFMSALSSAVFVFAVTRPTEISTPAAVVIGASPLLFWYISTFIPMNRYGDAVRQRLPEIERHVAPILRLRGGLGHFGVFSVPGGWFERVRTRVGIVFSVLAAVWSFCLGLTLTGSIAIAWVTGVSGFLWFFVPLLWGDTQKDHFRSPYSRSTSPALPREIEVARGLLSCLIPEGSVTYLSCPITSGREAAIWQRNHGTPYLDHPGGSVAGYHVNEEEFRKDVVEPNFNRAVESEQNARKWLTGLVITPANLHIPTWQQPDYHDLWMAVLGNFVRQVVFTEGWQYSNGCADEFCFAQARGLPCFTETGSPITRAAGAELLGAALVFLKEQRAPTRLIEEALGRLRQLPGTVLGA